MASQRLQPFFVRGLIDRGSGNFPFDRFEAVIVLLFWTKYAVSRQNKPGILKLTTSRGQSNLRTVFFCKLRRKGCYRIVSLVQLSFDCRSCCRYVLLEFTSNWTFLVKNFDSGWVAKFNFKRHVENFLGLIICEIRAKFGNIFISYIY